jgi:hypothetical protein
MASFFDKLKSGITEKAAEASIRSREVLETQQVKGKIGELENQKRKIFSEIGEGVYTMYRSGGFDQEALSPQCEAITAIDAQIQERERELEEIRSRAEASIAEQRTATTPAGQPYSSPAPSSQPSATTGVCSNCGAALGGAKFCPECGARAG